MPHRIGSGKDQRIIGLNGPESPSGASVLYPPSMLTPCKMNRNHGHYRLLGKPKISPASLASFQLIHNFCRGSLRIMRGAGPWGHPVGHVKPTRPSAQLPTSQRTGIGSTETAQSARRNARTQNGARRSADNIRTNRAAPGGGPSTRHNDRGARAGVRQNRPTQNLLGAQNRSKKCQ